MAAHTDNSIEIKAPLEFVWDRMMDVASWPSLYTEYAQAEVIEQDGNRIQFRLTTHPDENGQVWSWVSERVADPETHTSKSKRIETGPFEYMHIEWYFEPTDDGTKMRWVQDFSVKEGVGFDNDTAQNHMNKNTKIQMDVIKERLEAEASGGGGA